ncbi:hypothetical protein [Polaromonas sp. CG9_12]|uniref:hypothetical protein n=1 Tax=Polaromonas sp. CG_9.11 TaxID=2787730 RepID=UPI0004DDD662|nr:hypothetical protein [Polaromonas sp. CG_9.11]MBG6077585.1 hypothetical protein [Polaromonas sp. CG_9.11]CDS52848.1 hypothetical protein [Polaromonas sp. CG9_12]
MSFLSELKSRANALQGLELGAQRDLMAGIEACEQACRTALAYLQDLCAQLNVIRPPAPGAYSLDGKSPFPALAQRNFRCDARRKMLRNAEVSDYIGVGWDLLPVTGQVATHTVSVNFPPDLERVMQRLSVGQVTHERKDLRHPDSGKLLAYVFDYQTKSRAFITLTPEHDTGCIAFRITNVGGFGVLTTTYPAAQVNTRLLDELAKKLLGQPSRFG